MNKTARIPAIALCLSLLLWAPAKAAPAAFAFPRNAPEAEGVSSHSLLKFIEAADRELDAMNSVIIVRHGNVIAEGWWTPYNPESNHELYSLSKSFTSTAVGLAISEGLLSLDDSVLEFFPDEKPSDPSANLKAMRVRDLLCMSTGHQDEPSAAADKVSPRAFLEHPVPHKPGTHFKYNTAATFMLSAIVQKQAGQTVLDYLRPRLFEPLGIDHPVWDSNWQGVSLGGYGLRVRTEDIARFGQLYLQKGQWNQRQLIPAEWVRVATARQTSNGSNPKSDWEQGYGYQFWRCRHGAYRGDGAFGQYCLVLPEQDAVVAITSGVRNMQAVLNLVWDHLLPAFEPQPLPANPEGQATLARKLADLKLSVPPGENQSPRARHVLGRRFVFSTNEQKLESVSLAGNSTEQALTLSLVVDGVENHVRCGLSAWINSRGTFGRHRDEPIAASAAWTTPDTLTVKICAYETPFYRTLTLRYTDDQLLYTSATNVGFGSTTQDPLTGRMVENPPGK